MEHHHPRRGGGGGKGETPAKDAVTEVLGDDDLLREILSQVDSPTTLVLASLVSKRWLRCSSDRALLRRLRRRHPPRLLGFYIHCQFIRDPVLVPMPERLDQALRRTESAFRDAFAGAACHILDARNGRTLLQFTQYSRNEQPRRKLMLGDTLRRSGNSMVTELPLAPAMITSMHWHWHNMLLPEEDDDATCYHVNIDWDWNTTVSVEVSVLRRGAWAAHCSVNAAELPRNPMTILEYSPRALLTGGKVYMLATAGYIIVVDLAVASLSTIELPEGVAFIFRECDTDDNYNNIALARGDALHLFHVDGDKLNVWLYRTDDHASGAGEWVLKDSVPVHETCGHLLRYGRRTFNKGDYEPATVVGVGDNADFAFLVIPSFTNVIYLDLRTRRATKVHNWGDRYRDERVEILPFMTVWPPSFPSLVGEPSHSGIRARLESCHIGD